MTGSFLPLNSNEYGGATSLTFSYAAPCDALTPPTCASTTAFSGGVSCVGAVISDVAVDRCVLQVVMQRYGVSSSTYSVGVAVRPLNISSSATVIVVGVPQNLFLNISSAVTLSVADRSASTVTLTATGASCTWSSGLLVPAISSNGQMNVTVTVSADQPAGCSINAAFSLYAITGASSMIGTTALQPPAGAPVVAAPLASPPVAAPASAPVASAPVADPPTATPPVADAPTATAPVASAPTVTAPVAAPTAAPIAVRNSSNSIYLTVSGRSFPTDSIVDQIIGAVADALALDSLTDMDGDVLASVKRANFNYTLQIFFLTDNAIQARGLLVGNASLQNALVDAISTATAGLYSGVSFADSLSIPPVAEPVVPLAPVVAPVTEPAVELVGGIPGGAIAGGVIAGAVGIAIIICVIYGVIRTNRAKKAKEAAEPSEDGSVEHAHPKQRMDQTLLADKGAMVEMEAMERARIMSRQKDKEEEDSDARSSSDSSKSESHTKLDSEDQEAAADKKKKPKSKSKAKVVEKSESKSQSDSEEYSAPPESSSEEVSASSSKSSSSSSKPRSASSSSVSEDSASISSSKDSSESSSYEDTPKKKLTAASKKKMQKESSSESDSESDSSSN
jgi:hypothetical protein